MGILARFAWGMVFVAAAAVRLAYSSYPVSNVDGGTYIFAAKQILAGKYFFPVHPDFPVLYRTPVYPAFVALILRLTGSLDAVVWTHHIVGLGTTAVIGILAFRIWRSHGAALLAGAFYGVHFHFAYLERFILSETLAIALGYGGLLGAVILRQTPSLPLVIWIAFGVCAAAAALCRPEFGPLAGLYALSLLGGFDRERLKRVLAFLAPTIVAMSLWVLRNGVIADYWGLTPNSAITVLDGPAGRLVDWQQEPRDLVRAAQSRIARRSRRWGMNQVVFELQAFRVEYAWTSRLMSAIAVEAVSRSPGEFLTLGLRQAVRLMWPGRRWPPRNLTESIPGWWETTGSPADENWLMSALRWDVAAESCLLAPLAGLGGLLALFAGRRWPEARLVLFFVTYLTAVYAFLTYGGNRYRVILEPGLALLAVGVFMAASPGKAEDKEGSERRFILGRLASHVVVMISCFAAVIFIGGMVRFSAERWRRTPTADDCMAYDTQGRLRKALICLENSLAAKPADPALLNARAAVFLRLGRGQRAVEEWEQLARQGYKATDLMFNLGVAHHLLDNRDPALEYLSSFLAVAPRDSGVYSAAKSLHAKILAE
ncbi:MAG: hypothetical protein FD126_1051 [Elusimicrobia bacterium]|nr:MAG: hypothetical protein FD126_1051 [Elusimicrobiota bacterium]